MRFSKKMWPRVHKGTSFNIIIKTKFITYIIIVVEHPDTQLLEIGKIIGQMWREASEGEKATYQQEYEAEKIEYDRNLKAYQAALANQHTIASRSRMSTSNNDGSAAIQAVDEEDPLEMTKKRLSAIRFERDSRLMAELFTGACLPDTRTMVPQSRIEQLKRQATSLSAHQVSFSRQLKTCFKKRKFIEQIKW
jgi:SWI/SNF-related matrix-associated actin-dependent regulator of chromatin subfamily E protein 1